MNWFDWTLIVLWALNLICQPIGIGKPRKPKTERDAIIGTVVSFLLIVGLLVTRGVF